MRVCDATRIVVAVLCTALAGCATSRSEISLGSFAITPSTSSVTKDRTVFVRSVIDERVFEQAPRDPSTPSLGFEGAAQASAEIKARAIGRKRNTFGQALGDILLEDGQTVTAVIRENLATALKQAGYRVTGNAAETGQSPLIMDVRIKQFWAWFQPGFWAIMLNTKIATNLEVSGFTAPMILSVHAQESRQFGGDAAWIEIVNKALQAYQTEVVAKAVHLP